MRGHAYVPYPMHALRAGWCEQDAEDWWSAVIETVGTVARRADASNRVAAISLSVQGGTFVPVDASLRPLKQAAVWSDTRCKKQAAAFEERFGTSYMYKRTGWQLSNGLNAMQIKWLAENEPAVFSAADRFLSVPDYIAYKLTGRAALDPADAGINQLYNIVNGSYDPGILDFCNIKADALGEVVPSGTVIGRLTTEAKDRMGLNGDISLVSGVHDQYAALLGAGVTEPGDVLIGTGTAWVVTMLEDKPDFENGFSQSVSAVPGMWGGLTSLSTGGVCLDWLKNDVMLGDNVAQTISYDVLDRASAKCRAGEDGLMFFPYFSGGAYPIRDDVSKASFIGVDLSHDRFHMARAVMEGVAMQTVWMLESFDRKYELRQLKITGGATKSALWTQIIADIADRPVHIPAVPDMTCAGAAILAAVGAGVFGSVTEGCKAFATKERVIEPVRESALRYAEIRPLFKKRAQQLGSMYAGL